MKKRILDTYFLFKLRKKGFQASDKEVTRFFDETGWRLYDLDTMIRDFVSWRTIKQRVKVEVD